MTEPVKVNDDNSGQPPSTSYVYRSGNRTIRRFGPPYNKIYSPPKKKP